MSKRVGVKSGGSSGVASLDGTPASLGSFKTSEAQACSLCGGVGHSANEHSGGNAVVGGLKGDPHKASQVDQGYRDGFGTVANNQLGELGDGETEAHGPALAQNKATQFGFNDSPYTVGSLDYTPPQPPKSVSTRERDF